MGAPLFLKRLLRAVWAAASRFEPVDDDVDRAADGDVAGVYANGAFVLRNDVAADDRPDERKLIAEHAIDVGRENEI